MGKSFNDDVFNNGFNLDTINGLNISKEAIEESQESNKPKIDISNINLDEVKEKLKKEKEQQRKQETPQDELKRLMQEQERYKEIETEQKEKYALNQEDDKTIYVKKTMIFKQEYLDIIDGLATINDMQIKDVLNQLLGRAISELDIKLKDKALKTGKKTKPVKENKNIF